MASSKAQMYASMNKLALFEVSHAFASRFNFLRVRSSARIGENILHQIPKGWFAGALFFVNYPESTKDFYKVDYVTSDREGENRLKPGWVVREYEGSDTIVLLPHHVVRPGKSDTGSFRSRVTAISKATQIGKLAGYAEDAMKNELYDRMLFNSGYCAWLYKGEFAVSQKLKVRCIQRKIIVNDNHMVGEAAAVAAIEIVRTLHDRSLSDTLPGQENHFDIALILLESVPSAVSSHERHGYHILKDKDGNVLKNNDNTWMYIQLKATDKQWQPGRKVKTRGSYVHDGVTWYDKGDEGVIEEQYVDKVCEVNFGQKTYVLSVKDLEGKLEKGSDVFFKQTLWAGQGPVFPCFPCLPCMGSAYTNKGTVGSPPFSQRRVRVRLGRWADHAEPAPGGAFVIFRSPEDELKRVGCQWLKQKQVLRICQDLINR